MAGAALPDEVALEAETLTAGAVCTEGVSEPDAVFDFALWDSSEVALL